MRSTEKLETRLERVTMHEFFLKRINKAIAGQNYIEASWLVYACLENRYFRTIAKIKEYCKYSHGKCRKSGNELALRTKIGCLQRLYEAGCPCILNAFDLTLFDETKKWVKERNVLMHNLLRLDGYENIDEQFKEIAIRGSQILDRTYACCTEFRKLYYNKEYEFVFPEEAMEKCSCKPNLNKAE